MIFQRYLVYELGDGQGPAVVAGAAPTAHCSEATVETVCRLFADDTPRRSIFLRFLRQGIRGVLIHQEQRWQTYGWISRPDSPGPSHLPAWASGRDRYWIFFCRTDDAHRGRGLYGQAIRLLVQRARQESPDARVYIDTTQRNSPSRRAIVREGFEPRGVALVLDMPGLRPRGVWLEGRAHPGS